MRYPRFQSRQQLCTDRFHVFWKKIMRQQVKLHLSLLAGGIREQMPCIYHAWWCDFNIWVRQSPESAVAVCPGGCLFGLPERGKPAGSCFFANRGKDVRWCEYKWTQQVKDLGNLHRFRKPSYRLRAQIFPTGTDSVKKFWARFRLWTMTEARKNKGGSKAPIDRLTDREGQTDGCRWFLQLCRWCSVRNQIVSCALS